MSAATTDKLGIVSEALGELLKTFDTGRAPVSSAMGATASAESIGQGAGGITESDRKMIAAVAGLTGRQAKAMDAQIQQAAALGAKAAKDAGLKGTLTEEQSKQIADQVMKSLDGKHLGAQVQEKSRLFKTKAAIVGTVSGAAALTAATVAVAAKPLAWATDKVFGSKINESFSVGGALKKGFLASTAVFGVAAAYDMHKRNNRNNARQAALAHAVMKGAEGHASRGAVVRQAEPELAPQQAQAATPEQVAVGAAATAAVATAAAAQTKPTDQPTGGTASPATVGAGAREEVVAKSSEPSPIMLSSNIGAALRARDSISTADTAALAAKAASPSAADVTPPASKIEAPVVEPTANKGTAAKSSEPSPIALSSDIGAALRARGGAADTTKITKALDGISKLGEVSGGETVASSPIVSNIKPPEPAKDHAAVRS